VPIVPPREEIKGKDMNLSILSLCVFHFAMNMILCHEHKNTHHILFISLANHMSYLSQ
jgi:hypothetical protein